MDKRTLIGLIVIGAILFGFTWYNSSIQEKLAQEQQTTTQQAASEAVEVPAADASATVVDSASGSAAAQLEQHIGVSLFKATEGTEKHYEIENDLMKVTFSNKGGRVASVVLKDYKTYNGSPLVLFPDSAAVFDLSFFVKQQFNNIQINTGDYYFVADSTADLAFGANETEKSFTMRLDVDSAAHVDFVYKIYKDNYMIDFDVRFVGMERLLAQNQSDLEIIWQNVGMQNEKGFDNENNYTTIAYKYPGDESIEQLGMSKEAKSETINSKLKWVAFKQQFFSSILVSQNDFQNGTVEYTTFQPGEGKIKTFKAKLSVPFSPQLTEYNFNFYFGPNKFSVLKKYGDLHFERLIPLGGWIVGWINRWLVIPTFDTLGKHIANYGIIILLLTIILKILISPLTYKSYLSTAKMRLLKPEVDKLNEKYPNQADAMKKQQEVMALYSQYGVSPMGGCLPMLIQFPILMALFMFVPSAIELRQQSFLWADDLSTYDAFINFPFHIPFLGSHLSLFCLLMTVTNILNTKFMMQQQDTGANPQMAAMKWMSYLMPVMFLFILNDYPSGLNYYYFISTLVSVVTTIIMRKMTNEEALLAQLEANKKDPKKMKKTGFAARLEAMQKQQEQMMKEKQNRK